MASYGSCLSCPVLKRAIKKEQKGHESRKSYQEEAMDQESSNQKRVGNMGSIIPIQTTSSRGISQLLPLRPGCKHEVPWQPVAAWTTEHLFLEEHRVQDSVSPNTKGSTSNANTKGFPLRPALQNSPSQRCLPGNCVADFTLPTDGSMPGCLLIVLGHLSSIIYE